RRVVPIEMVAVQEDPATVGGAESAEFVVWLLVLAACRLTARTGEPSFAVSGPGISHGCTCIQSMTGACLGRADRLHSHHQSVCEFSARFRVSARAGRLSVRGGPSLALPELREDPDDAVRERSLGVGPRFPAFLTRGHTPP